MTEATATEVQNDEQGQIKMEALQTQLDNMKKDLDARDKKINDLQGQIQIKDAEVQATQATAKDIALGEVQNDYEARIRQLEQQNKNMFIQREAQRFGVTVDDDLLTTLGNLPQEQASALLERQAQAVENAKKSALEQRSAQDMSYLQRTGLNSAPADPEFDYYG